MLVDLLATLAMDVPKPVDVLYAVVFLLVCRSIYRSYTLLGVPGPWYTLVSDLVLVWAEVRHDRTRWIHALHERYGPVVRLSNGEIHFNSVAAVRQIYGVRSGCRKEGYYAAFRHRGVDNMFSALDDGKHAERKRAVASHYSRTTLLSRTTLALLRNKVDSFITLLDEGDDEDGGVEIYRVLSYLTLDVVSAVVYGDTECADALLDRRGGSSSIRQRIAEDMIISRDWCRFWRKAGYPTLARLASFLQWCRAKNATGTSQGTDGVDGYIAEACERAITSARDTGKLDPSLVASMMQQQRDACTDGYLLSESRDHVIAGSDTTTTVLTYLLHHLANDSVTCTKLREGLLLLPRLGDGSIDTAALDSCAYLNAVTQEALRLFAAIPMTLPRITNAFMSIEGFTIPANTRVGVQCYSLHRDPIVFPNPDVFDPDRWQQETRTMEHQMWAFSSGSRSCIGKSLALLEMKMTVAAVVCTMEIDRVGASTNALDDMYMWEDTTRFTMVPRNRGMRLRFRRLGPIPVKDKKEH